MTFTSLLTNRGRVLQAIALDPEIRVREIADAVGITQRTTYRILDDLVQGGFVARKRVGRRTQYLFNGHAEADESVTFRD